MRARAQINSHPIHPMLVAFPIGLWVTSFVMDLVGVLTKNHPSLYMSAWYCILAGCVGAAAAAVAGAVDLFTVIPPNSSAKNRGYLHGGLNALILVLFIGILAYRGNPHTPPNGVSLVLSAIGVLLLGISGWLGGTLVYRNQIGVDHRYAGAGIWRERTLDTWERPACAEHELAYGQMMLVKVGEERVVVGRCSDGMVAFSDHCTHRGGPLSDGTLVGCTVQCPWHGSQFDAHSGRVVAGPAGNAITTYDVQVRAGEVYVSPRIQPERKAA